MAMTEVNTASGIETQAPVAGLDGRDTVTDRAARRCACPPARRAVAGSGRCGAGRRRHAHCLISGAGWIGLGVLALVEADLGRSVIDGYEQPAFVAVLAVAVAFEGAWYLARGTNAMTSGPQVSAGRGPGPPEQADLNGDGA
jgi:hypothetical protein